MYFTRLNQTVRRIQLSSRLAVLVLLGLALPIHSQTLDNFRPDSGQRVYAAVPQTDGKIVVAAEWDAGFISLSRVNADGTFDNTFYPVFFDNAVCALTLRTNGQILLGGRFASGICRLNPDGTLDNSFDVGTTSPDAWVQCLVERKDGRILVGGHFNALGGYSCTNMGILNPDGTPDPRFRASADGVVCTMVTQSDNKILIGGTFATVCGQPRSGIARLSGNGTLDTAFDARANSCVLSIALQADGKILAGGYFTTVGGKSRPCIARLNSDGTLDDTFTPIFSRPRLARSLCRPMARSWLAAVSA